MAIKPILFNTEMVRAILDGRKTCTRRVAKTTPFFEVNEKPVYLYDTEPSMGKIYPPCQPGDILYVRETWTKECGKYYYRADYDSDYLDPCETLSGGYPASCRNHPGCDGCMATSTRIHWHPSIHMPKEAARIWLKVTDVRVERLQEITDEKAKREGIQYDECPAGFTWKQETDMHNCYTTPIGAMQALWDSTIKKSDLDRYGWEASPWVWVIEFEPCEKPEEERR